MHLIAVLIRVALSAVFGTAGVTKLLDRRGTEDAVKNFGAPESLAPVLSIVLPIVELAIAVGLLFVKTTRAGALAALGILGLFVVAIGINLARGRTHDCHCFGQLYSRPLGWPTLMRNLIFALSAGFVWWRAEIETSRSIAGTLAGLSATQGLALIGALLAAVVTMVYLYRRRRQVSVETAAMPKGLPVNSVAPAFEVATYAGGTTSLAQLLAYGKPLLLMFTSPNCGPCVMLFAEIKEWQQSHSEQLTIALISSGTIKENFVNVARNSLGQVLLQEKREVAEKYGANVTPTAVVVNTSGKIASQLAAGADEIRHLLDSALGNSHGSHNSHSRHVHSERN
jgi:methylamine dehydrogenase accessory protein MauD